jgi:hypothetical protein
MRAIVAVIPLLASATALAQGDIRNNSLAPADAVTGGQLFGEVRPRYNRIVEDAYEQATHGGTYRVRLGWRTAPWQGWRATLEGLHTGSVDKHFNDDPALLSTSPYPLLPDPAYHGVNQAQVEYAGTSGFRLRAGRQVVRFENSRWVSDNDFRQVPQVFDGVRAYYEGFERTQLEAGYFSRVRTTSGTTSDLGLALLRAAWNPAPGHVIGAYGVFHDQAQNGAFTGFADNSYRVLGARAEGAFRVGGSLDLPYLVEAAHQDPYAGGDSRVDARYWRVGAGLSQASWTLRLDQEVKGSNHGLYGLQTPLTDFYAFNGWTLNFFNTPRQGLRDRWLTARYAIDRVTFYGEVHRFRADFGGGDLGREADLGVTVALWPDASLRLQHARYDSPPATPADIRKTWVTLSWLF